MDSKVLKGTALIARYLRAFLGALRLTLRGEAPPQRPYAALRRWIDDSGALVDAAFAAADRHGMTRSVREQIVLKLDGRDMSMQTILAAVEHHIRREYPYLLDHPTEHSVTAIYASNMNDQYRVLRLREDGSLADSPVREAIARLCAHLNAIPPSTASGTSL